MSSGVELLPWNVETAVQRTGELLSWRKQEARSFSHRLMDHASTAVEGRLCAAITAQAEGFDELAAALFDSGDPLQALTYAPAAFLAAVLAQGTPRGRTVWQTFRVTSGVVSPSQALELSGKALRAGLDDVASGFCELAAAASEPMNDPDRMLLLAMQAFLSRRDRPAPLAGRACCVEWRAPWRTGYVGREPAATLPRAVGMGHTSDGLDVVPDETWALVTDWPLDRDSLRRFASLPQRERCLVLSLTVTEAAALTDDLAAALRRIEPIGAADEGSAILLRQAGVVAGIVDGLAPAVAMIMAAIDADASIASVRAAWADHCRPAVERLDRILAGTRQVVEAGERSVRTMVAKLRSECAQAGRTVRDGEPCIELALAADERLAEQLPVVLESIVRHASLPVRVRLLTRGLRRAYWRRLEDEFGCSMALVFHDASAVRLASQSRLLPHTTVSTLDRLLLPELFDVPRLIYLDVDLVVLDDLAPLWNTNLDGARLAAKSASSPRARTLHQMVGPALERLSSKAARDALRAIAAIAPLRARAFNAGVLVLNLERMRAERFSHRFLPMVEQWGMNDQDVLNIYAAGARVELDGRWNAIPRQDLTDGAAIVHFAGPVKPWSELYIGRANEFHAIDAQYRRRTGRPSHGT